MIGKPFGCLVEIGEEWNKFHSAMNNCVTIQPQHISGPASMYLQVDKFIIELGG